MASGSPPVLRRELVEGAESVLTTLEATLPYYSTRTFHWRRR